MTIQNKVFTGLEHQPFHLADPSPWPLYVSISVFHLLICNLLFFQIISYASFFFWISLTVILSFIFSWFYNIVIEATFQGMHTKKVQKGLKTGMILFIVSEIMFFFSFFWAFLHCALAPSIWVGNIWPPEGIETISALHLPVLNTAILLSSGVSLTWAHRLVVNNRILSTIHGLVLTVFWGLFFTFLQYSEYNNTIFSINDSIYGSAFFLLTGFHGFHVILGTALLIVCLLRFYYYHFFSNQHIGFECSIWYWHFVDIVWIFLYLLIYCWGC